MTVLIDAALLEAFLGADRECQAAWRWYRLTCSDIDVFTRRRDRAVRAGEVAEARDHERQVAAARRARGAAWTEYRRSVARLANLVGGLPA